MRPPAMYLITRRRIFNKRAGRAKLVLFYFTGTGDFSQWIKMQDKEARNGLISPFPASLFLYLS